MVIEREPGERVGGLSGEELGNYPQPVDVWNNSGESDKDSLLEVQAGGGIGQDPSGQKMCDGAQSSSAYSKALSITASSGSPSATVRAWKAEARSSDDPMDSAPRSIPLGITDPRRCLDRAETHS